MPIVPGIETIVNLVGEPPPLLELERKEVVKQQYLQEYWNGRFIAMIPYCYSCKVPLDWHTAPRDNSTMFSCPNCKRMWIMLPEKKEKKNG